MGKHGLFLCINHPVFDFVSFAFGEDGFAINADKGMWVPGDNRHCLRAAVGDAA